MVYQMSQQQHRCAHETFVLKRDKKQDRQDEEGAPAKHEKVSDWTKKILLWGRRHRNRIRRKVKCQIYAPWGDSFNKPVVS
ncbi:hypothetical protein [Mesorhizobium sp.]|uniref:hypothetical protein n=1 Tax=Mesorhizobium sp. TaxID=1871066 RepID=UPI0025809774|nr:hypothetical protein [Mesorhizobium sp.]